MAGLDSMDLLDVNSLLTEDEVLVRDTVARFVDDKVLPIIRECFEEHRFPTELIPEMAELGLFGRPLSHTMSHESISLQTDVRFLLQ